MNSDLKYFTELDQLKSDRGEYGI
jgi:hypothetical protein